MMVLNMLYVAPGILLGVGIVGVVAGWRALVLVRWEVAQQDRVDVVRLSGVRVVGWGE